MDSQKTHVQNGTPLHVLQELGGWSSYEMVRRYAHLSADHLAHYADRLSALRLVDTNLAQSTIQEAEPLPKMLSNALK